MNNLTINKKKCNICFENKIIKNECDTCGFLMCKICYNTYLQHNNVNCAHCKSPLRRVTFIMDSRPPDINIIIERNEDENYNISRRRSRRRSNDINFCNWYTLIILGIYFILCYYVGYLITGTHKIFFFLNFFLGFLILGVCMLLLAMICDTCKNCCK